MGVTSTLNSMITMGVASFLNSVWRPSDTEGDSSLPPPLKSLPSPHISAALMAPPSPPPDSPRARQNVSFTLPDKLYAWLEAMALLYNYGSVHKSVRDLLQWASAGQDDDLDWLFGTSHEVAACLGAAAAAEARFDDALHDGAAYIAAKQAYARLHAHDGVVLDAHVTGHLALWIAFIVRRYSLRGPSDVLEAICRCAIVFGAADDVFDSDQSGHDLPRSTAELYHDLGLIRYVPSPAALPTPSSSPP